MIKLDVPDQLESCFPDKLAFDDALIEQNRSGIEKKVFEKRLKPFIIVFSSFWPFSSKMIWEVPNQSLTDQNWTVSQWEKPFS